LVTRSLRFLDIFPQLLLYREFLPCLSHVLISPHNMITFVTRQVLYNT
jgi:hypothetical protein